MKPNNQVLLVVVSTKQSADAVSPARCFKLELAPVKIYKLAVSFFVKSYYFHIVKCLLNEKIRVNSWKFVFGK